MSGGTAGGSPDVAKEQHGNCNVCGVKCTLKCAQCHGATFYCSREHQKLDWKKALHRARCERLPSEEEGSSSMLAKVETTKVRRMSTDDLYDTVQHWCRQIQSTAEWASEHLNVTALIDITRSLKRIHELGRVDEIHPVVWSSYDGSQDDWGYETWSKVVEAWTSVVIKSRHELLKQNVDLAQEFYEIYLEINSYGSWGDLLEPLVETVLWVGMVEARRLIVAGLPKVDPASHESLRKSITKDLTEHFEAKMQEKRAYGIYRKDSARIVSTLLQSNRLEEYVALAVEYYAEQWNKSMDQASPSTAWTLVQMGYWGDDAMERQYKLGEIAGIPKKGENGSPEEEKIHTSLRFVFLDAEKYFRWYFEDAVDPDEKANLRGARYG